MHATRTWSTPNVAARPCAPKSPRRAPSSKRRCAKGSAIRDRGRADAERERERILEDARHEGARLVQNAHGELDRARIAARDQLRIELIEAALNRARAIARERIDEPVNARLVAKTVDELAGGGR